MFTVVFSFFILVPDTVLHTVLPFDLPLKSQSTVMHISSLLLLKAFKFNEDINRLLVQKELQLLFPSGRRQHM